MDNDQRSLYVDQMYKEKLNLDQIDKDQRSLWTKCIKAQLRPNGKGPKVIVDKMHKGKSSA